jgi:hypothetical protein
MASINHYQTLDQLNYFIFENRHEFSLQLRDQMREFFHHTAAMRRTEEYHVHIISKVKRSGVFVETVLSRVGAAPATPLVLPRSSGLVCWEPSPNVPPPPL